jgi:hypothetical protein
MEHDCFIKITKTVVKSAEILKPSLTEEQMTKIAILMWSAVFHTLSRAVNGVERDRMYASLKLGDDFSQYTKQEPKKSILDALMPWK